MISMIIVDRGHWDLDFNTRRFRTGSFRVIPKISLSFPIGFGSLLHSLLSKAHSMFHKQGTALKLGGIRHAAVMVFYMPQKYREKNPIQNFSFGYGLVKGNRIIPHTSSKRLLFH